MFDTKDPVDTTQAMRLMESGPLDSMRQRAQFISDCRRLLEADSVALCHVRPEGEVVIQHVAGHPPDDAAMVEIRACAAPRARHSFSKCIRRASTDLILAGRGPDVVSAIVPAGGEPWMEEVVECAANRLLHAPLDRAAVPCEDPDAGGLVVPPGMIVGDSPAMRELFRQMSATVSSGIDVLLSGETGTGKELLARMVHNSGPTRGGPFVAVNCAAIPGELLEAELFGVERRVATGVDPRGGLFVEAHHGSMFLDEIAELPERLQAKLLRVIQEREVLAVGATRPRRIAVRIISASNQDLSRLVAEGRFRPDLYYRLRGLEFQAPPLRERVEDIPALALEFLLRATEEFGRNIPGIGREALEMLQRNSWPGNIRELQTEIRRAVLVCPPRESLRKEHFRLRSLAPEPSAAETDPPPGAAPLSPLLRDRVADVERAAILETMQKAGGNCSLAARMLGITRNGLTNKLRRLGLHKR